MTGCRALLHEGSIFAQLAIMTLLDRNGLDEAYPHASLYLYMRARLTIPVSATDPGFMTALANGPHEERSTARIRRFARAARSPQTVVFSTVGMHARDAMASGRDDTAICRLGCGLICRSSGLLLCSPAARWDTAGVSGRA